MSGSDATPPGYRRTDPDETLGRLVYRQQAEAEARMALSLGRRRVRLEPPPAPAEAR